MKRVDLCLRTVVAGGVAALAVYPLFSALSPRLAAGTILAVHAALATALVLAAIAPSPRRALGLAVVAAGCVAAATLVLEGPWAALVGGAVALAACRSGVLFRSRALRALALEAAFTGGGLVLAIAFAPTSVSGVAFATWVFFLVQSGFFLVGGVRRRSEEAAGPDPFDAARDRLRRILDEPA